MRKHGKYIIFSVPIEKELENEKKIIYRKKLINSLDLWRAHYHVLLIILLNDLSSILWGNFAHFSAQTRKNKKNPAPQKILMFQEMELSNSKIKKFLIFYQNKAFSYFWK